VVTLAPVAWVLDRVPGLEFDTKRGDNHGDAFRLTFAVLGSLSVVLIGLVGREVRGERVGLVAAGIAAVYPNLWVNDGLVMSETLTVIAVASALYLAYRYRRNPRAITAVGLGVACGLAGLARAEMILLVPFLALPTLLLGADVRWPLRMSRALAALLAVAILVGPWIVFNLTRFEDPTYLSTNDGQTLLGANCEGTYHGPATGLWLLACLREVPGDRSQVSSESRRLAFDYIGDHSDRVPAVAMIRVGRLWNLYRPGDMVWYNDGEGREKWISRLGLWFFYPLLVLSVGGAVLLRRSWSKLWPLLVVIGLVTLVGAATYGLARLRAPAEISLVVLAAVAIDAILRALVDRAGRSDQSNEGPQVPAKVPAGSTR
jgi:4-amino-4-deoxy-L-arabinose transferase-like glycosyltransferase